MNKFVSITVALAVAVLCSTRIAGAQPVAEPGNAPPRTATSDSFLLGPPKDDGPVVVRASLEMNDINEINDEQQTFEFTGVLTLRWHDKRQAFDPAAAGVDEKVYQGAYQFNELSPSWFPQVVLVNSSGSYESRGVVLRVQPDGTLTLIEKLTAIAKTEFNFRRFPFDKQTLEAVFEVLGFDNSEVVLQVGSETTNLASSEIRIPQWTITGISMSTRDRPAFYAGRRHVASSFVTRVDVQRESFYVSRFVTLPLIVIVLLSFSVFWMDRSSLGDRVSVSFIGILTVVAYQVVMSEILPRIAYVTWMNGFLNISFLTMVGAVLINLVVGALDQQGRSDVADRVDRRCRWIFPLTYFALILLAFGVAFLLV
jgi:Neurotransmitter-gated ion-channel ligand binding domain